MQGGVPHLPRRLGGDVSGAWCWERAVSRAFGESFLVFCALVLQGDPRARLSPRGAPRARPLLGRACAGSVSLQDPGCGVWSRPVEARGPQCQCRGPAAPALVPPGPGLRCSPELWPLLWPGRPAGLQGVPRRLPGPSPAGSFRASPDLSFPSCPPPSPPRAPAPARSLPQTDPFCPPTVCPSRNPHTSCFLPTGPFASRPTRPVLPRGPRATPSRLPHPPRAPCWRAGCGPALVTVPARGPGPRGRWRWEGRPARGGRPWDGTASSAAGTRGLPAATGSQPGFPSL